MANKKISGFVQFCILTSLLGSAFAILGRAPLPAPAITAPAPAPHTAPAPALAPRGPVRPLLPAKSPISAPHKASALALAHTAPAKAPTTAPHTAPAPALADVAPATAPSVGPHGAPSGTALPAARTAPGPAGGAEAALKADSWSPALNAALKTPTNYEIAQEPYKSRVNSVFKGIDVCGPVSETAAQQLWSESGRPGVAPSNFSTMIDNAINSTIWAYPLLSVVSSAASVMGQAAAGVDGSAVDKANVVEGQPPLAVNSILKYNLANYNTTFIVAPNSDTLYTSGFLDLSGGPLVLNIPDSEGRFYVMQMLDAYTNIPFTVGSLNSPMGKDLRYVLVPPGYQGPAIPDGYDYEAYFTTPLVWILGRIYAANNATDLAAAKAFQNNVTVTPLFKDNYTLPTNLTNLARSAVQAVFNPSGPGTGNLSAWWPLLGEAMMMNPPITPEEQEAVQKFANATGVDFANINGTGLPSSTQLALNLGLAAGLQCIEWLSLNDTQAFPLLPTGWSAPANQIKLDTSLGNVKDSALVGGFFTNPTLRALIARLGLGANPPKTAVYYVALSAVADANKAVSEQERLPLDGSLYNYTITFPSAPNVTGFWSVTVYKDGDRLFFGDLPYNKANDTYRYNINKNTPGVDLKDGKDFTLYLSSTPPPVGSEEYKNWIPIGKEPDSKFSVYLRLYGPDQAAQTSSYNPPPVIAHKGTWGGPAASNTTSSA